MKLLPLIALLSFGMHIYARPIPQNGQGWTFNLRTPTELGRHFNITIFPDRFTVRIFVGTKQSATSPDTNINQIDLKVWILKSDGSVLLRSANPIIEKSTSGFGSEYNENIIYTFKPTDLSNISGIVVQTAGQFYTESLDLEHMKAEQDAAANP